MYKKLFTPLKIGNVTIPNRLTITAMDTDLCDKGYATDRYIGYHEERAKGGWGLIVTEDYAIQEQSKRYKNVAGLWSDDMIESHKKLTDTIHKYDTKIFVQLYHCGMNSTLSVQKYAPSRIGNEIYPGMPEELTVDEIKKIVKDFGKAALRAKKAGFDGVEIHAAHGYLICEFLSSFTNKRTDEYGGNFQNRTRFLREIMAEIRATTGDDFAMGVRMPVLRGKWDGTGMDDTLQLAQMLEDCGADYLNITMGYMCPEFSLKLSMYGEHAFLSEYGKEMKEVLHIPIMMTNYINDPKMADNLLIWNKADFVGIGQGSLADPYIPKKAMDGDENSIRYCLKCNIGCLGGLESGTGMTCMINPAIGKEYRLDYSKVEHLKNVYIAGGGPGGMEAAIIAASRGHKVTLFEKRKVLGGQFLAAAYPPGKGGIAGFIMWQIREMKKQGVEIRLSTALTKEIVKQEQPDAIVIATGGTPFVPSIPGIDKPHVYTAEDVLLGHVEHGQRMVIAGGGEVGCETATLLATTGVRDVTVVEMAPALMQEMGGTQTGDKNTILNIMRDHGVKTHVNARVMEVTDEAVVIEKDGQQLRLPADVVVLAMGYRPNNELSVELEGICKEISVIGGAVKTSNALQAIHNGFDVGMSL